MKFKLLPICFAYLLLLLSFRSMAQGGTLPLNNSVNGDETTASGDVWSVTTPSDGLLKLTLTTVSPADLYITLFDSNGTTALSGSLESYNNSTVSFNTDGLATGTYIVKITPAETDFGHYTLSDSFFAAALTNDVEPNGSRALALNLPLNSSKTGHAGYYYDNNRDTADWYKVTTTSNGLLRLYLNTAYGSVYSNNTLDVNLTLYDNDGVTQLGAVEDYSGGAPFAALITTDGLAAGTYYIKVQPFNTNEFANYSIADSFFIPPVANDPEPNGSRATAVTLGLNDSTTGQVGYYYNNYRDTADWYKVTTNSDGLLRVYIRTLRGSVYSNNVLDVNVTLYDNDGATQLGFIEDYNSNNPGLAVITTDGLATGTYYIKVQPYSVNEFADYTLGDSLFTPPVANDPEPNGSPATALILPQDGSETGHLGYYYNNYRDTADWFKVTTTQDGMLSVRLSTLRGSIYSNNTLDVNVTVYDIDGTTQLGYTEVYNGNNPTNGTLNIDRLAAGTFYIKVQPFSVSEFADYILSDSLFTYNPNDNEPDNSPYQATTIPANRTLTGHISFYYNGGVKLDDSDWFKINYTGTAGTIQFTFDLLPHLSTGALGDVFLSVYKDTTAAPIFNQEFYTTPTSTFTLTGLTQGYYYIKVSPYNNSPSYFTAYSITDSFVQVNIAQISLVDSVAHNGCSSDSLTYSLSGSHSPYTVRLFRDGVLYDSVVTTNSTVSFTGLSEGNYFATVYGDGATDSAYGKSVVTQFLPPYPVGLYTNSIGVHTAKLNWAKYDCVKRYEVEYRATGSGVWITANTVTDTSAYALSGLAPYTLYSWRVASIDSVGGVAFMSPYSDSVTFRTLSDTAHIALIHEGVGSSCDGDTLEYSATHSEAPYTVQLYRNGAAYGSTVSVNDTAIFTGLPSGNYYARATGTGSGGSYGTSDTVQLTPPVPTGLSPYDSTVTTTTTAAVYWNALTCAENFNIQYMIKGSGIWLTVNTVGDSSSFTLTGLTADTLYYWRIASVDPIGISSAYSVTDSFMTLAALPVTLLYFNGSAVGNTTQLNWKTAAELNNKEFVVERSADGINFTVIGQVAGAGTTSLPHAYEFTDTKPLQGTNFYRLQQVDDNGHFVYSQTVTVNFGSSESFALYPNPATSIVNIVVPQSSSPLTVIITDLQGRTVMQKQLNVNSISLQLDVSDLAAGVYNVTLLQGSLKQNQKLIKE